MAKRPWEVLDEDTLKKGTDDEEMEDDDEDGEEEEEEEPVARKKKPVKKAVATEETEDDSVMVGTLEELTRDIEASVVKALEESGIIKLVKSLTTKVADLQKSLNAMEEAQSDGFTYVTKAIKPIQEQLKPVNTMAKAVLEQAEEDAKSSAAKSDTPPVTKELADSLITKSTTGTLDAEKNGAGKPTVAQQIKLLEKAEILRDNHGIMVATSEDFQASNYGQLTQHRYDEISKAIADSGKL